MSLSKTFLTGFLFASLCLFSISLLKPEIVYADKDIPDLVSKQKNGVITATVYDQAGNRILSGSGFIMDKNGIIATGCNIIAKWFEKGNTLDVEIPGGVHLPLKELISSRCENHLALFSVDAKDLFAVKLDRNCKLKQGVDIVVIGGPSTSSKHAISTGKIKSLRGKGNSFDISNHLISELNGSPVFNMKGAVIGAVVFQRHKAKAVSFAASIGEIAGHLDRYRKSRPSVIDNPVISPPSAKLEKHPIHPPPVKLPDDPKEFFSLGCAYDLKRLYRNAIEAYQQSVRMKPDFPDAYINLGVDFYKLGEYGNAVNAFNQALQLTPDSVSVCSKLASAYILQGSYSMAVETLEKAIDLDPKNIASRFNLGIAYYLNGDFTAAFEQYQILKEMDKEQADRLMDVIFSD